MKPIPDAVKSRGPGWFIPLATIIGLSCLAFSTPRARAATVIDQIGILSTAGSYDFSTLPEPSPSQIFHDFTTFNSAVLENFTVTSAELNVIEVGVVFRALGGFEDFLNIDGFLLNIFSDESLAASSLLGDVGSLSAISGGNFSISEIFDTSGLHEYGLVRFSIDVELPQAGEYWIGVSAVSNASTLGQFMLVASPVADLGVADALLANPGEGFGGGALALTGNHHAVSVIAVPEPGLPAWIFITALSLARLRRRNV